MPCRCHCVFLHHLVIFWWANFKYLFVCRELAKDFVVSGTAWESLYGACESMYKPNMVRVWAVNFSRRNMLDLHICLWSATYYTASTLPDFYHYYFVCAFFFCLTILFSMTKGTWRTLRDHIASSFVVSWPWLPQRVGRLCSGCVSSLLASVICSLKKNSF